MYFARDARSPACLSKKRVVIQVRLVGESIQPVERHADSVGEKNRTCPCVATEESPPQKPRSFAVANLALWLRSIVRKHYRRPRLAKCRSSGELHADIFSKICFLLAGTQ